MVTVTDPNGVKWSVERAWFSTYFLSDTGGAPGEAAIFALALAVVTWPLWFIAHWLGVRWVIGIYREETQVGEEKMRGWNKSERRIQGIAESAAAETPQFREIKSSARRPRERDTFVAPVTDEPAAPGEPTRCVLTLFTHTHYGRRFAIDVGKDAISVIDLNTNALIASASRAQVTATPAKSSDCNVVLVVGVPGLQPLTIRPSQIQLFSWRGKVAKTRGPAYLATDEEWLTLVEKLGLTPYLSGAIR